MESKKSTENKPVPVPEAKKPVSPQQAVDLAPPTPKEEAKKSVPDHESKSGLAPEAEPSTPPAVETRIEEQSNHSESIAAPESKTNSVLAEPAPQTLNPQGTISGALVALKEHASEIRTALIGLMEKDTDTFPTSRLAEVAQRLGAVCSFTLDPLPQFVQIRRAVSGETVPFLELLTMAQQYLEEENAVRASETVVNSNKADAEAFHALLAKRSEELR